MNEQILWNVSQTYHKFLVKLQALAGYLCSEMPLQPKPLVKATPTGGLPELWHGEALDAAGEGEACAGPLDEDVASRVLRHLG